MPLQPSIYHTSINIQHAITTINTPYICKHPTCHYNHQYTIHLSTSNMPLQPSIYHTSINIQHAITTINTPYICKHPTCHYNHQYTIHLSTSNIPLQPSIHHTSVNIQHTITTINIPYICQHPTYHYNHQYTIHLSTSNMPLQPSIYHTSVNIQHAITTINIPYICQHPTCHYNHQYTIHLSTSNMPLQPSIHHTSVNIQHAITTINIPYTCHIWHQHRNFFPDLKWHIRHSSRKTHWSNPISSTLIQKSYIDQQWALWHKWCYTVTLLLSREMLKKNTCIKEKAPFDPLTNGPMCVTYMYPTNPYECKHQFVLIAKPPSFRGYIPCPTLIQEHLLMTW